MTNKNELRFNVHFVTHYVLVDNKAGIQLQEIKNVLKLVINGFENAAIAV